MPEQGGATSFTKANIFVKPRKGMATFFAYKGRDQHMDTGLTGEVSAIAARCLLLAALDSRRVG